MKKIISTVLSLSLIATIFSCIPAVAITENTDFTVTQETNVIAKVTTDKPLVSDVAKMSFTETANGTATPSGSDYQRVSFINNHADYTSSDKEANIGMNFWCNGGKPNIDRLKGDYWVEIKYDLTYETAISEILVSDNNGGGFQFGKYKLYAGNEVSPELSEDNLIYECTKTDAKRSQIYRFNDGALNARYVTLRIVIPVGISQYNNIKDKDALDSSDLGGNIGWGSVYARVHKFLVYGTNAGTEAKMSLNAQFSATDSNTQTVPDLTTYKSITNADSGAEFTLTQVRYKNDVVDGNPVWTSEVASENISKFYNNNLGEDDCYTQNFFVNTTDKVQYIDGTRRYVDFIYDLGAVYDISHISIVHGNNGGLMTGKYKLYASKTESRNFTDSDLLIDYSNDDKYRSQTFSTHEGKKVYARYVALRITNPVANSNLENPPTSGNMVETAHYTAVRIAEFQVYGECTELIALDSTLSGKDASTVTFPNLTTYNAITTKENKDNFSVKVTRYKKDTGSWVGEDITSTWANYKLDKIYDGVGTNADNFPGQNNFIDTVNRKLLLDGTMRYIDITYDLGAVYDVSHIAVVNGSTDGGLGMGHYQLHASESKGVGFTEEDMLVDYINDPVVRSQTFKTIADQKVYARYINLRVINPVTQNHLRNYADNPTDSQLQDHIVAVRLGQFQVYGSRLPNQPTITGGSVEHWSNYKGSVDITHNLIANQTTPDSAYYINTDAGVNTPTNAMSSVYASKLTATDNAYDSMGEGSNLVNFVEHDGTKVTAIVDDEARRYIQLNYKLDSAAKITSFTAFGHISSSLSPSHYKVSFANSEAELFTDTATTIDVRTYHKYTVANLNEGEQPTATWASIRIICGVSAGAVGGTMAAGDYYARLSHFKIDGEWLDPAVDTLNLTSDVAAATLKESAICGKLDNLGKGSKTSSYITATAPQTCADENGFYTFEGWYKGDEKLSSDASYDYILTDEVVTLTAKYITEASYTVCYTDKSSNVLYTAYAKSGEKLSNDDIFNASHTVPEIYGYVRKLDENGLQKWSDDDRSVITGNLTLTPIYEKAVDTFCLTVTGSDGKAQTRDIVFDQKITISDSGAKYWKSGEKIIAYGTVVVLYATGDMDITACTDDAASSNTVTVMDTIKSYDTLSVMVHINNIEEKEISEVGAIFMSGSSYDKVGNVDWTDDALAGVKTVRVTLNSLKGNDYMCTLIGIPTNKDISRVAQAYIKYVDGTVIYSAATEKQVFNNTNKNPLIRYDASKHNYADPYVVYHDGYYYHCYSAPSADGYGIRITKSESLFDINTPIESALVMTSAEAGVGNDSWYAPELIQVGDAWYVYSAPLKNSTEGHQMHVLKIDGSDPLPDGENTKYENLGFMTGLTPGSWLNIDGTIMPYKGKNYFVWSDQGSLKIAELLTPTTLGEYVSISTPTMEWERENGSLNEGPALLERNGRYFISFSCCDSQRDDYKVGLLELKLDGDPMNKNDWTKWAEPVLVKDPSKNIYGPGHNSFTKVKVNGNWVDYIVYHAHDKSVATGEVSSAWYARNVYVQPVYWDVEGKPVFMPADNSIY